MPWDAPRGLIETLDGTARQLADQAATAEGAVAVMMPDWLAEARRAGTLRRPIAWRNTLLRTPLWRRLHVEYFEIPGEIGVIHVCAFPDPGLALPILGFDIVAGQARATGCFLDLSPTVPAAMPVTEGWARDLAPLRADLGEARPLPDWASAIFSPHAVAVRPRDPDEVGAGLALGAATLARMLRLGAAAPAEPGAMRAAAARYVDGQRRNERTRRMLAACVGATLADRFIADCLFPLPDDGRGAPRT